MTEKCLLINPTMLYEIEVFLFGRLQCYQISGKNTETNKNIEPNIDWIERTCLFLIARSDDKKV